MLVYAAGEAEGTKHLVRHASKTLEIRTLDLSGGPERILDRIAVIAERLRWWRDRACKETFHQVT